MSDGGKGSAPRPLSVSDEEYRTRWDAIFGRDLDKPKYQEDDGPLTTDQINQIKQSVSQNK